MQFLRGRGLTTCPNQFRDVQSGRRQRTPGCGCEVVEKELRAHVEGSVRTLHRTAPAGADQGLRAAHPGHAASQHGRRREASEQRWAHLEDDAAEEAAGGGREKN